MIMKFKAFILIVFLIGISNSCNTPYKEMGFGGGLNATRSDAGSKNSPSAVSQINHSLPFRKDSFNEPQHEEPNKQALVIEKYIKKIKKVVPRKYYPVIDTAVSKNTKRLNQRGIDKQNSNTGVVLLIVGLVISLIAYTFILSSQNDLKSSNSVNQAADSLASGCMASLFLILGISLALVGLILMLVS